jgi:DNA-binding NtrC family response regulator
MLAIWEPGLLQVMNTKLQKLNYDVVTVDDEDEFLHQTATRDIDVILLDIRTRGESRLRLLTDAKAKRPATEIILLSNQYSLALAMEGIQAGAYDDIPEPFEMDVLAKKIQAAWKRRKKAAGSRSRFARFWEKTMMAVAYAEAGEHETAIRLAGSKKKKKKP